MNTELEMRNRGKEGEEKAFVGKRFELKRIADKEKNTGVDITCSYNKEHNVF